MEIVPTLEVGGAQRMAALLSEALVARGHTLDVVALGARTGSWIEDGLTTLAARESRLHLHFLGKGAGLDLSIPPRLGRLLRRLSPEVVHTHLHTVKYSFPASRIVGARCYHTLHNLAEHEIEAAGQRFHQMAFRAGVRPVAIGDAVAESIRRVYHLAPVACIPNGIPVSAYRAPPGTRAAVRAELGIPADTLVFFSAGRLNAQKNHDLLVDAMRALPRDGVDRLALVAGEGELRGALEERAEGLPVGFLGVRPDVCRLMAAADVFVLPSRWEGNPLVVMEAMAAGLPVLATDVGCVAELVTPGTGRLVRDGDVAGLAREMAAITREDARQMGRAAAAVADERFDVARMADAYDRLFMG